MKRWLGLLLALCLCCSAAAAEYSVEEKTSEARDLTMNKASNTFIMTTESRKDQVVDADLNPLSAEYSRITVRDTQFEINENGLEGLLDEDGTLLIPAEYGDVQVFNDRWAAGIRLKPSTAENYDYESWFSDEKKFYLIDSVDLYYRGNKGLTLTRMEWNNANAHGDYLIVQNREKKWVAYDKDFNLSPFTPESGYSEYSEDWNTHKITHVGSGKEAFTAGCTLTPAEVVQFVWVNNDEKLLDLQGNVLAELFNYPYMKSVDAATGMIRVKDNSKMLGLVDSTGKQLIPCNYDEFDYDLDKALGLGYLYAVRDGKGGFVSLRDGSESGFTFLDSAGKHRSGFIVVEDPREGTILIGAGSGELPGRYKEADVPYTSSAPFATVTDFDGTIHVIDTQGNDVLPNQPEIKNSYDVTYSEDGSLILLRDISRVYHVYKVTETGTMEPKTEDIQGPAEEPAETRLSADVEETWTCENGHSGNTGNFCTECGAPRPVAQEDDGTWTCENGHGGNTGKFCSECGAPRP